MVHARRIIEKARSVMGSIDLDPASCEAANEVVEATQFYTIETDGLTKKWVGKLFMNPPYSSDLFPKFVDKMIAEIENGNVKQACVIVNNTTDTREFQRLAGAILTPSGVNFPRWGGYGRNNKGGKIMSKIKDLLDLAKSAKSCGNDSLAIDHIIDAIEQLAAIPHRITPEETGRVWCLWTRGHDNDGIAAQLKMSVTRVKRITRGMQLRYPTDRENHE